jgi:hypothetical protein
MTNKENRINSSTEVSKNDLVDDFEFLEYEEKDSSIISQQKEELKRLEKEERDKEVKKKQEAENKLKKEREQEILMKKQREEEEEKKKQQEYILNQLPQEPNESDPDSSLIIFRLADGSSRIERRFKKSDKIRALYTFANTIEEKQLESGTDYILIQPFPFIAYTDLERTLEEEKLFPNAIIQIKEK